LSASQLSTTERHRDAELILRNLNRKRPYDAMYAHSLGLLLSDSGRFAEMETVCRRTLDDLRRPSMGPDGRPTWIFDSGAGEQRGLHRLLGKSLAKQNKLLEAEDIYIVSG
jgi:hypothetical protein